MNYLDLYWFLKGKKLKFWKHRCLRKLKKYLGMLEEPYNYLFVPPYMSLIELIELQRLYCWICGYDTYNLNNLGVMLNENNRKRRI